MAVHVLRLSIAAGVGYALFLAFRWLFRQSRVIALIVTGGFLLRAVIGLILFWVSYFRLPLLRSLQLGEGFWTLTPDAQAYYRYAATGVQSGLAAMNPGDSSPFFVKALSLWMSVVGVSPAAGLFLNVSLYVVLCVLVVRVFKPRNEWRADLPCAISIAAFSFSPVAVIHATQPMKEDLFAFLITLVCIAVLWMLRVMGYGAAVERPGVAFSGALTLMFVANYGIAGIRPYYAVIVWLTIACVLAGLAWSPRVRQTWGLARFSAASVVVLGLLWVAYWQGAGPSYWGPTLAMIPNPTNAITALQRVRTGFVLTGGGTNMASPEAVAVARTESAAPDESFFGAGKALLIGFAAEVIPISALMAFSLVKFSGGRGLLPIADLDTVFFDLSLVACLTVLYRRRADICTPFVLSALCLSLVTAGLLAYVVTNFGSLFRLKMMIAVPVWLLCLGLSPAHRSARIPVDASKRD